MHWAPTAQSCLRRDGTGEYKDNQIVRIGGIITGIKTKPTKSGNGLMAYATLEDLSGSMELTVFPSIYMKHRSSLIVDNIVSVSGKLNMREDQNNTVLVDMVGPLKPDGPGEKREAAGTKEEPVKSDAPGEKRGAGGTEESPVKPDAPGEKREAAGTKEEPVKSDASGEKRGAGGTEESPVKPDAPGEKRGAAGTEEEPVKSDAPGEKREVEETEQRSVEAGPKRLYLRLDTSNCDLVEQLKTIFRRFPGNIPVVLCDSSTGKGMLAARELYVNPSDVLLDAARETLGDENVKY